MLRDGTDPQKQKQLNWSTRYNIVKGVARGMLYLDEDSPIWIVHRDLKAANVLLDTNMTPNIAYFAWQESFKFNKPMLKQAELLALGKYQ